MKTLKRNQKPFWYALRTENTENVDEYGNPTGEISESYGKPKLLRMSYETTVSEYELHEFGLSKRHMMSLMTDDMNCPLDEESAVWFERDPNEEPNYRVVRKFKSLNHIRYFVERVDIGE